MPSSAYHRIDVLVRPAGGAASSSTSAAAAFASTAAAPTTPSPTTATNGAGTARPPRTRKTFSETLPVSVDEPTTTPPAAASEDDFPVTFVVVGSLTVVVCVLVVALALRLRRGSAAASRSASTVTSTVDPFLTAGGGGSHGAYDDDDDDDVDNNDAHDHLHRPRLQRRDAGLSRSFDRVRRQALPPYQPRQQDSVGALVSPLTSPTMSDVELSPVTLSPCSVSIRPPSSASFGAFPSTAASTFASPANWAAVSSTTAGGGDRRRGNDTPIMNPLALPPPQLVVGAEDL